MPTIVVKTNNTMVNLIFGINFYYQNQPFLAPEIGVSFGLFTIFVTVGLRFGKKDD